MPQQFDPGVQEFIAEYNKRSPISEDDDESARAYNLNIADWRESGLSPREWFQNLDETVKMRGESYGKVLETWAGLREKELSPEELMHDLGWDEADRGHEQNMEDFYSSEEHRKKWLDKFNSESQPTDGGPGFPGDGPPPLKPTGGDTSLYDQWAKAANAGKSAEFWKSGNRAPQSLEDKQGDGMQGSEAYLPAGRWSGEPARMPKLNPQQIATDQYNMRYELSPEAFRSLGKVPSDHNFAPSGNVGYRNVMRSLIQDAAKAKAQMPAQWRGPQSLEEEVLQQKAFPDAPELENYDPYVTPQKGEYELDPSELETIQGYGADPRKPKSSPYGR